MIWKIQHRSLTLGARAWIMGVLNVTPDSFSDGGQFIEIETALAHARQMIADGAEIVDIGGESSRPGAFPISETEEMARVLPVIAALRRESDVLLSIDTCKPSVAAAAIATGANIINDISGFRSPEMLEVIASTGAGAICMHMRGTPADMQAAPQYGEITADVRQFFAERLDTCRTHGIAQEQIIFDPGIGFGKSVAHNLTLIRNLALLRPENRPILIGVSRKSFLGKILGDEALDARFWPTVALTAYLRTAGADILRVHDVLPNVHSLRMIEAIHG